MNNYQNNLVRDLVLVVFSILIAIILAKTGALQDFITSTQEIRFIGSFIAGIFFTSVFTTAPAIVALGEIAHANSIISTALLDRKSTRLNSSHSQISYAVFCLKK